MQVHEAVDEIVLHAAELSVDSARLEPGGGERQPLAARLDEDTERLVLTPRSSLTPGPAVISIEFAGILNDKLHGFYRSAFTDDDGVTHAIATTQFEATDARRAFPCFDEPDRKAVFSVTLDVPEGLAAYSNGPVVEDAPLPQGGRRVRFGDTIPMSTYLVAFVVGPLVATDPVEVRGTPVRIVHVPGKAGLTAFALEAAGHALEFFEDWFGIDYPAEKLDLVAIPDFAFGAMENLGCVTFREAVLLVDPAQASRLELERVADVISHEIAHMWFGDLVTMRWWNGIWLNEAFATLMELLCVDHFRPEWQRWVSFGIERDTAMATDGLHATRPVEYPVGPPEEAQGMFDVLTYQKGAGVLRMLERYLGADRFRDGVRRYLEAHRLGNTETADLWDAIEAASGEPVRQIMDSWIFQGGFPLVTVDGAGAGAGQAAQPGATVVLGQKAFSYADADGPSAIGSTWTVPIIARAIGGGEARLLLGPDPQRLALGDEAEDAAVVVNAGGSGYYRVRYAPAQHRRLAGRLDALDRLERFNLLGDTWAVVVGQQADPTDFLLLAEALGHEDDPDVWALVTGALSLLDRGVGDDTRALVASYARALLSPALTRLGWDTRPGEGPRTATLQAQLIAALGTVGKDPDVRAEAHRRYDATAPRRDDTRPRPELRRPQHGGRLGRERGVRRLPGALPPARHTSGGDALPVRVGGLQRPGPGGPDLRAGPHRGADAECALRRPVVAGQPRRGPRDVGTCHRALGRARSPHPGQHPPAHARGGDVAVSRPRPRPGDPLLRASPPSGHRATDRRPDPGASGDQRLVRVGIARHGRAGAQRRARAPGDELNHSPIPLRAGVPPGAGHRGGEAVGG